MIHRAISRLIAKRLSLYPAVGLIGLRQCGKTTLAKSLYFNLEQASDVVCLDLAENH